MNKLQTLIGVLFVFTFCAGTAMARNDILDFPIEEALSQEQAKESLGNEVRFYFGDQAHAKPLKSWGVFSSNKKTNAFLKSDDESCNWAFISAMISLRDRALKEGGNAVVNIKSNYKGKTTSSETTFQCGAGNIVAGVALKGKVVQLP